MRICFYTEIYYKGGLDTFLINIFNSWPREDDQISLICNESHAGLTNIINKSPDGVIFKKYNRLFTSNFFINNTSRNFFRIFSRRILKIIYRLIEYPILFPWYVISLTIVFTKSDYDRLIVVNGGYPASLLCRCAVIAWRFANKPESAIMNFHNSATSSKWYERPFENAIDFMVEKFSKDIVSVSKNCLNSLNNRRAFIGSKKLSYIYNGIEDPVTKTSGKNFLKKNSSYCLMLATYEQRKGHKFLLKAFQEVVQQFPNMELRIHGHGSQLQKKIVLDEVHKLQLNKNVFLGGHIEDIKKLYTQASIVVVPSQEYESFGLTIIEAMAYGIPVITTDVGGMPEVLENTNAGYVCSKDKPLEFANFIIHILQNKQLALDLGNNGRVAFIKRYTALKMASKYDQLIQRNL